MVSRPPDPRSPEHLTVSDFAAGVFGHWRVAVTRAFHAARTAPERLGVDAWLASVTHFALSPVDVMASGDTHAAVQVSRTGYVCLAVGATVAAFVTFRGGAGPAAAATDAVWLVVWAAARYAVLRLASGDDMRLRPSAVAVAWAGGLVPLVFAATPVLGVAALVASAALTWRALRAAGAEGREVTRVVGWSFGGQAAAEAAAWIVRGGVIYALLLGR
jgi:hypothetical protein